MPRPWSGGRALLHFDTGLQWLPVKFDMPRRHMHFLWRAWRGAMLCLPSCARPCMCAASSTIAVFLSPALILMSCKLDIAAVLTGSHAYVRLQSRMILTAGAEGPFGPCNQECDDGSEPLEDPSGTLTCPPAGGGNGGEPSCPGLIGEPCCTFIADAGPCTAGAICDSQDFATGTCIPCGGEGELACFESAPLGLCMAMQAAKNPFT